MPTISVKLSEEDALLLEKVASKRKTTKSQVIRDALKGRLKGEISGGRESFYETVKDLAGSVEDGPPDLSTDPKYFEGFGR